jgi:ribosomal protein S18 acetylase RimI-like enzyme
MDQMTTTDTHRRGDTMADYFTQFEGRAQMQEAEMARSTWVSIADEATPEVVEGIARLLPHLSQADPPTTVQVDEIINSPATVLFLARLTKDGPIVGTLTLVVFRLPSGIRAWIEDVITDPAARGRGVGEALNRAALGYAAALGARNVDLTSRPTREAANRLYQRLGFKARETNVYRYDL